MNLDVIFILLSLRFNAWCNNGETIMENKYVLFQKSSTKLKIIK